MALFCKKVCDMNKQELDAANEKFKPTHICIYGFIHINDTIQDVYAKDKEFLQEKNITFNQIADVLETITQKYHRKRTLISDSSR